MDVRKPTADFDQFMERHHIIYQADHAIYSTNLWGDHLAYLHRNGYVLRGLFALLLGSWVYTAITEQTLLVIMNSVFVCMFLVFFRQSADYIARARAERIEALKRWKAVRDDVVYEKGDGSN